MKRKSPLKVRNHHKDEESPHGGIGDWPSPDPDCLYSLDSETLVDAIPYWLNLPGIKKVPSRYRSRCATSIKIYLSSMDVTERVQDAIMNKLFEVLDVAVSPDLPIHVKILDMSLRGPPEIATSRSVPATRESIEGLESKGPRGAHSPLDSKFKLEAEGDLLQNVSYYQRLVGKLIYLTITRHDISYSVTIVSQFMHAPTKAHLSIVQRILRYLKGSVGRGLLFKNNGGTNIGGYVDADWAENSLDRKSTTGFCTLVGGNMVTWKNKKQTVIARSSAEEEYRAMASTACELIWLKGLLQDLGFQSTKSMPLHCDNQAAMHIASNPVFHERTKHIEVDCHYIRAQVQSKVIQTIYTRSQDQLADIFTKALPITQFLIILSKLGSINLLDPS
ncbi:hypothetical protein ACLB2K_013813 [Fragaria x ananassa]